MKYYLMVDLDRENYRVAELMNFNASEGILQVLGACDLKEVCNIPGMLGVCLSSGLIRSILSVLHLLFRNHFLYLGSLELKLTGAIPGS